MINSLSTYPTTTQVFRRSSWNNFQRSDDCPKIYRETPRKGRKCIVSPTVLFVRGNILAWWSFTSKTSHMFLLLSKSVGDSGSFPLVFATLLGVSILLRNLHRLRISWRILAHFSICQPLHRSPYISANENRSGILLPDLRRHWFSAGDLTPT